jgi:hypothetical protein
VAAAGGRSRARGPTAAEPARRRPPSPSRPDESGGNRGLQSSPPCASTCSS